MKNHGKLLINGLDANDILSNFQFGFRHKHSTTQAVITLTERIPKTLVTGKILCDIFINFQKAFNNNNNNIYLKSNIQCI